MLFNLDYRQDVRSEKRKEMLGLEGSEKALWKRCHFRRLWKDRDHLESKSEEGQHSPQKGHGWKENVSALERGKAGHMQ